MNIDDIIKEFREQFGKDFIRPDESIDHERLDDAERFLRFALESYGKKMEEKALEAVGGEANPALGGGTIEQDEQTIAWAKGYNEAKEEIRTRLSSLNSKES